MGRYQFDKITLSILENLCAPLAVYQFVDKRVVTLALSDGFCKMFGFEDKRDAYLLMDRDMYRMAHPDDAARIADAGFRFATEGGRYEVIYRTKMFGADEYRIVHANGEHVYTETGERLAYVWYTDEGSYVKDGGNSFVALDVALSQALHEKSILQASYYDYLTGLPGMSYFFELAEVWRVAHLKCGGTTALLYIDLCGMKYYNRKYGFEGGDKLLRTFANVLKKHFSNENCSRFGSDHFCVFTDALGMEDKLRLVFSDFASSDIGETIPARVGIYLDDSGSIAVSALCDRAKYACDTLRNSFVSGFTYFSEDMLTQSEIKRYIIDNIDRAIEEGWIKAHYQPIIRAANGRVCEEEALARWIDPEKGMLSPADFIPVLEEAKLINKLDLCICEQMLVKMKDQQKAGLYVVPESLNLSRVDFEICDIVEEIRRRVDDAGIERSKLIIEITESVVAKNIDFMKSQIDRFRSMGFKVWMDDFGSGYSSLDVLHSIRFDLIKLDMHFIKEFGRSEENRIIITELIKMAGNLGIDTVCEGVETKEQRDFLTEIGCTKLQGYYYCKAIPLEKIIERNRLGISIGFENPAETEYYAAIGRINLYDTTVFAGEKGNSVHGYFNTLSMAVYEISGNENRMVRCNNTFRSFLREMFGVTPEVGKFSEPNREDPKVGGFYRNLYECGESGGKLLMDEMLPDGSIAHTLLKRIAVNPVTGTKAVAVAVLAVTEASSAGTGITFSHVAKALSSGYIGLYHVDLLTEHFWEYAPDPEEDMLAVERQGDNFFEACRLDAPACMTAEERERFFERFTKENILSAINERGIFVLHYRIIRDGEPISVVLRALKVKTDDRHIIIGITESGNRAKR